MFAPFQVSFASWFSAQAEYEWVPDPPLTEPCADDASATPAGTDAASPPGQAGAEGTAAAPGGRLVFKRMAWRPYQTAFMQENAAWAQVHARKPDEADQDRPARAPARPPVPAEPGAAEESGVPPSADSSPA
jgi:hypothetical protein